MKLFPSLSFCLAVAAFAGCGSEISKEGELKKRIREAAADQQISAEEMADLQGFAQSNDDIKKYADCAALRDLITSTTERKGAPTMADCNGGGSTTTTTTGNSGNFFVYVENSASMFGYMQGATEFREAMMDIPSRLVGNQMSGEFFFINDQTYPATKEFRLFVDMLNKEKAGSKDFGNTAKASNSKLDDILQRIVNDVVRKNSMAVFTSDCIFDIDGKNPQDELPNQKFKIKSTMQQFRQKGDYAALVMRFTSAFDGNYYDCKNGKTILKGVHRPFYVWVIGKTEELRTFVKDYNISTVRGFRNHAFFYNSDKTAEKLFFSFLERTNKVGEFSRPSGQSDRLTALESARLDGTEKLLKATVAVDLSKIPTEESYLLDAENWMITSDKDDPFTVSAVKALSPADIHNNDKRFVGTATHLITIETNKLASGTQRLQLSLKKDIPVWAASASTNDDVNIKAQLDKTFGFSYLMEGLAEAFDEPGSTPVHCKIKLEITK